MLEKRLSQIECMYSGDIIKSHNISQTMRIKEEQYSNHLINSMIDSIYKWSFDQMMSKSEQIIVKKQQHTDIVSIIQQIPIDCKLMFFSHNYLSIMDNQLINILDSKQDEYLPDYLFRKFKLNYLGNEIIGFYSPLIKDEPSKISVYFTDGSIQSLVWSIQNMSYTINKSFSSFEHTFKCPVYECDYNVYEAVIIDTERLRDEKINSILN